MKISHGREIKITQRKRPILINLREQTLVEVFVELNKVGRHFYSTCEENGIRYLLIFLGVCETIFMIELKKLNGASIFVNPDLIRAVESTPDTIVHFIDGESILVKDSPKEIVAGIVAFRRKYSISDLNSANNVD